jgi:arabinofuranosyltransferase
MGMSSTATVSETEEKQSSKITPINVALTLLRSFVLVTMAVFLYRLAWMSDDSLITLRQALNITHGWGPGFNATESVQAYTHPLWFLLWTAVGTVSGEWILGILLMSVALTVLATAIVLWQTKSISMVLAAGISLIFSNAFMEYAVSGLENSLSYLAVGATLVLAVKPKTITFKNVPVHTILLGLSAAAVSLTRLDLLLLVVPAMLYWLWQNKTQWQSLLTAATAFFTPVIAWHTWAYITYGSLLPNTFEAKRNVNIPATELAYRGIHYISFSVSKDFFTGAILVLGLLFVLWKGTAHLRIASVGVFFYLMYTVYVGGDFMTGRFLAVPVYTTVLLAALTHSHISNKKEREPIDVLIFALSVVAIFSFSTIFLNLMGLTPTALYAPTGSRWVWQDNQFGYADERGIYVGLFDRLSDRSSGNIKPTKKSLWVIDERIKSYPHNTSGERLTVPIGVREDICGGLGYYGMVLDPRVHLIDNCGLSDAFIAKIPYTPPNYDPVVNENGETEQLIWAYTWRMAHFDRTPPEGYIEAIATNDPSKLVDQEKAQQLAQLWETIRR